MRVAMLYNNYTRLGGEELSTAGEIALLREHGVEVIEYARHNRDTLAQGALRRAGTMAASAFNRQVYEQVRELMLRTRPEVAHVQNFWFSLSPSVLSACHAAGVPTVLTLRNYRLMCLNGLFLREGKVCERCLGGSTLPGVLLRCYNHSALQSALVHRMVSRNRRRGTWDRDVDLFVSLTEFARAKYLEGGLPAGRLAVKPNFIPDPGPDPEGDPGQGRGAVFIGRLSESKGIGVVQRAWTELPGLELEVVGDGPARRPLEEFIARHGLRGVTLAGQRTPQQCLEAIRRASFLVMASNWYETFGRVIVEAFACGRPVVASRLGTATELVEEGRTGLLFEPGDPRDLARQARWMAEHPAECRRMGREARREYERKFTPEINFQLLIELYRVARENYRDGAPDRKAAAPVGRPDQAGMRAGSGP